MPRRSGIMANVTIPHGGAMRLIHTSDWHLGRTLHGENLLPAQDDFLRWLLDEAVRQQAGAVVVAGDIYDRAVPPVRRRPAARRDAAALCTGPHPGDPDQRQP